MKAAETVASTVGVEQQDRRHKENITRSGEEVGLVPGLFLTRLVYLKMQNVVTNIENGGEAKRGSVRVDKNVSVLKRRI